MNFKLNKNMKHVILIVVAIATCTIASAQTQAIQWNSSVSIAINSGDSLLATISFVSNAQKIDMVQGDYTLPFIIQSIEGVWENITRPGKLTCHVKDDSATSGIITLGRDDKGLYIILDMTSGNPDGIFQRFIIDSHELK